MTNRVSEPRRIRVFGKRSPVGPDRTPFVFALEELQHPAGSLNELNRGGHKHDAGETNRIALQNGVIPARYGSASVSGPLLVEPRLRPRRHRRHILLRDEAFSAAAALILPDSRQVAFRGRRRRGLRRRLLLTGLGERSGRESQYSRQRYHETHQPISHFESPATVVISRSSLAPGRRGTRFSPYSLRKTRQVSHF